MKIRIYRKKRRGRAILLCAAVIIAVAAMALLISALVRVLRAQTDLFPESVLGVDMYTQLVPEGDAARPQIERRIKYIVLHETGNTSRGADAKAHSTYLTENNKGTTSWHYTVDDTCIYHHIPDTEVAWHAGDSLAKDGGNLCGIGVEICVNRDGDFERAFDNAARLCAYLIDVYHLSVEDIKQHGDFISKNCPETIRDEGRMEEFCELVREYLKEL